MHLQLLYIIFFYSHCLFAPLSLVTRGRIKMSNSFFNDSFCSELMNVRIFGNISGKEKLACFVFDYMQQKMLNTNSLHSGKVE